MKNDLTTFEKNLLRALNIAHNTKYTHKNFMEWSSSKEQILKNLEENECVYEVLGLFVAIKEKL